MPTYVYQCKECGHRFEIFQSFRAEPLTTCPECQESALRKVLFPAGVVFKGSGFYVTDSRTSKTSSSSSSKETQPDGAGTNKEKPDSAGAKTPKKEPARSGAKTDD
ncbi:MAG: FmdB family transcriptional regulator [Acidimicrobiia bacterium]|nr:FmdB family transcriptional regulator [Acidimicrobiia bacterium]